MEYPNKERVHEVVTALQKIFGVEDCEVARCIRDIEMAQGVSMDLGAILVTRDFAPWLESARSGIDPYYWDRYRTLLVRSGRMSSDVVSKLDEVTDRILGHCEDPHRSGQWDRRGMVVGHVQSGKTGNYTGLICKAADAGYRFIVVIAGVHNNLRNQTQERIDEGFVGRDSSKLQSKDRSEKWVGVGKIDKRHQPSTYTSAVKDFTKATASAVGNPLANNNQPVVFVIKKNSTTLRNLLEWLRQNNTITEDEKIDMPMLLVDDEADNASINIAHGRGEVSKINGQIRDLLALFAKSSYVGYTATPFANIFVDPDTDDEMLGADLFPRDFIVSLDPPSNYSGPNRIFQETPDAYLVPIEDAEAYLPLKHKIDWPITNLPPSLLDAVRAFVVARAIRLHRGDTGAHMSMLVNASRFTGIQGRIQSDLHRYVRELESAIRVDGKKSEAQAISNPSIRELHSSWRKHYSSGPETWSEIQPNLLHSVAAVKVINVNSKSSDLLEYSKYKNTGLTVIAVGGFALSRGLTLEGLMVSYFYRRSLMYDTILQMGRWFGFRDRYDDLCRIWMTEESQGWYEHITDSIDLLREEFHLMEKAGASPNEFGLKVRSHPDSLMITARNKVGFGQRVTVEIGLGNYMIETAALLGDAKHIEANTQAAQQLIATLKAKPTLWDQLEDIERGWLLTRVDPQPVLDFITRFRNSERSLLTQPQPVLKYIEDRRESTLAEWDILFPSLLEESEGNTEFADWGLPIIPQIRSAGGASDRSTILVTNKQRVAGRGIEKVGVEEALALDAEREFDKKYDSSASKSKRSYPDRIYRAKRARPLLIVHALRMKVDKAPNIEQIPGPITAWGISFPRPNGSEPRVEYLVNATWIRENLLGDTDEEDLSGDND